MKHLESGMRRLQHVKVFIIVSLEIIIISYKRAIVFFNNVMLIIFCQWSCSENVIIYTYYLYQIWFLLAVFDTRKLWTLFNFLVPCAPLNLENGLVDYSNSAVNEGYPHNTVASFLCDFGYYHNGTNSTVCQSSGYWNGQTPRCEGFHLWFLTNHLQKHFCLTMKILAILSFPLLIICSIIKVQHS